jgi:hypothetical protein
MLKPVIYFCLVTIYVNILHISNISGNKMEVEKEKKQVKKIASPKSDVPSAPTMDDFYIDPGLGDAAPLARLVFIIVPKSGLFHVGMVKSRLYSPLRDKYGSSKVPPPDLVTQIRTSLRYLFLKQSCV